MITIAKTCEGRQTIGQVDEKIWDKIQTFQSNTLEQEKVLKGEATCVYEFNLLDVSGLMRRFLAFAPVTNEPPPPRWYPYQEVKCD